MPVPKKKKEPAEDPKAAARERMAHARAANPANNKELAAKIAEAEKAEVLRPHLDNYLRSVKSLKDFEALRRKDPLKALEFATDRVWGRPSQANSGGTKAPRSGIAVLIQLLSGQKDTPQPVVLERDIPGEDVSHQDGNVIDNQ